MSDREELASALTDLGSALERTLRATQVVRTVVGMQEREFEFRRLISGHVPCGVDPDSAQRILSAIHSGQISHYRLAHEYWSSLDGQEREAYDRYALSFMTAGYVPPKPKKERAKADHSPMAAAVGSLLRGD